MSACIPFDCVKNTIRLRSGLYFDLANPQPHQFAFVDIAGALSKLCRFGGQCIRFYSVAEHSYLCWEQAVIDGLPHKIQQAIFMHDAAEAFIGDCVNPLKIMLHDYNVIETRIERCIGCKFGIDFEAYSDEIRKIDREMLIAERRALFSRDDEKWTGELDVRCIRPVFRHWPDHISEERFYQQAEDLGIIKEGD